MVNLFFAHSEIRDFDVTVLEFIKHYLYDDCSKKLDHFMLIKRTNFFWLSRHVRIELNLIEEDIVKLEISVDDAVSVKEEEADGDFSRVKPVSKHVQ